MDGESLDIKQEKIVRLKELLPEVFTEEKIDWEKLKAALGEDVEFKNERYVLNWAGKSDAFKVLQALTTATLAPDRNESIDFDNTGNVFIEGENLEVLKVLQKSYFGKIKMIDIDPPYNTGNDNFIYPDRFSETKEEYLERIGDKDELGYMTREGLFRKNSKDSGHYHSNWLSMMYPRLFLARNLLREDGIIFVSIDDREFHNLRLLMNEIFGEENFIANFIWMNEGNIDNQSRIKRNHEYVLMYAKNEENIGHPPVIDPNIPQSSKLYKDYIENTIVKNGPGNPVSFIKLPKGFPTSFKEGKIEPKEDFWPKLNATINVKDYKTQNEVTVSSGWSSKDIFTQFLDNNLKPVIDTKGQETTFYLSDTGAIIVKKKRLEQQSHVLTILRNMGTVQEASKSLEELGVEFSYPKPARLIKYLVQVADDIEGIFLDFFAGSCTTAHAVLDLNKQDNGTRKFICVQLPEKCDEKSEAFKAGYKTIADIGKERIRRVIKKIKEDDEGKLPFEKTKQDLGFKVFKLQPSNFKIWRGDGIENGRQLEKHLQLHLDSIKKDASEKYMLYELLLKSGRDLNSKIENTDNYYRINDGEMVIALSKMDEKIVDLILEDKPQMFITLDRLFKNNDQLKTNTLLQMKDAGIEFKVV
ncbi:MAG: site-specific DNA-methyltransferase [Proteobacteria bacterium]|nr:site-specific DNA-methyltransferase [Pseudomonadota bacterium]MBU4067405.1 site-specific DNA-methyltransferase [Pseudomonadota bacterium]